MDDELPAWLRNWNRHRHHMVAHTAPGLGWDCSNSRMADIGFHTVDAVAAAPLTRALIRAPIQTAKNSRYRHC
jgi:hypothetical protein